MSKKIIRIKGKLRYVGRKDRSFKSVRMMRFRKTGYQYEIVLFRIEKNRWRSDIGLLGRFCVIRKKPLTSNKLKQLEKLIRAELA